MAKKKILSISYDEPLLITRQMLLAKAGYSVTSAAGFAEAIERCRSGKYDLILMGHSMPQKDKRALIATLRQNSQAPLVSIRRHGEAPIPEAAC